ncbi:hypothetical protein DXG01_010390 [Tephrocybe rancida]|nr:hypothetical protein DXG01_010390 [Tephrocybe rancida]
MHFSTLFSLASVSLALIPSAVADEPADFSNSKVLVDLAAVSTASAAYNITIIAFGASPNEDEFANTGPGPNVMKGNQDLIDNLRAVRLALSPPLNNLIEQHNNVENLPGTDNVPAILGFVKDDIGGTLLRLKGVLLDRSSALRGHDEGLRSPHGNFVTGPPKDMELGAFKVMPSAPSVPGMGDIDADVQDSQPPL